MKSITNPVFTNTCGKIFRDRIVLASHKGDETFYRNELTGISFRSRILPKELAFACAPAILVAISFFLGPHEVALKWLFLILGPAMACFALYKAKRKYTLSLSLTDGRKKQISVHTENIMDARKFVKEVDKMIHKSDLKHSPEHSTGAIKTITAEA